MMTLNWSDVLGKRVRTGEWRDQAVSTVQKIEDAVVERQWELAAELVDYFMEEAKVSYTIYRLWFHGFLEWLELKGVDESEREAELDRLRRLMAFPDGE